MFQGLSNSEGSQSRLEILYEDNHLIAIFKVASVVTQVDGRHKDSLTEMTKRYLKEKYQKKGHVFLGILHRLDKGVSGIVLFAKNSKSAGRLSSQIRERIVEKRYLAWVEGVILRGGILIQHLSWNDHEKRAFANNENGTPCKESILSYEVIRSEQTKTLLEVNLLTGRKHQIRCQLSSIGHPIVGDVKYGARMKYPFQKIGLLSHKMMFHHPVRTSEKIIVSVPRERLHSLGFF